MGDLQSKANANYESWIKGLLRTSKGFGSSLKFLGLFISRYQNTSQQSVHFITSISLMGKLRYRGVKRFSPHHLVSQWHITGEHAAPMIFSCYHLNQVFSQLPYEIIVRLVTQIILTSIWLNSKVSDYVELDGGDLYTSPSELLLDVLENLQHPIMLCLPPPTLLTAAHLHLFLSPFDPAISYYYQLLQGTRWHPNEIQCWFRSLFFQTEIVSPHLRSKIGSMLSSQPQYKSLIIMRQMPIK